ncbi:MAG: outer membrane lipoprotein-sorting protein [Deltaproteobacteria bacterium]|nr:outer membrane lipoprotein-sorting protein [Deltaproteobacteria bacterium]
MSAIEKDAAIFRRQEFYDEDMKLAKVMTFDEIKMIGGRRTPTRMTMDNKKKTDHQTVLVFDQLDFNINIPESTFTQRHLTSQGR